MSERKIIGAKYIGRSTTFYVGTKPIAPGETITEPPDAVHALCSHPECEIIYDATPEEDGPPDISPEQE